MNLNKIDRDLKFIYLSNLLENYNRNYQHLNVELIKILKYENIEKEISDINDNNNNIQYLVINIINKFKVN